MSDIAARLRAIIGEHGRESVGWYMGNPGAFSYSHTLWAKGFLDGLGSPHYYSAGSQDVNNRFAASALLYGSPLLVPIPDLNRTDFLFMVGANPLVSHGSVLSAPRVREQLNAVVDRGGRVVVVDPRRTETARQYEHVPIRPDTDAWLLLSMLHVVFAEGLADRASHRAPGARRRRARRAGGALRPRAHGGGHRRAGRDGARAGARLRRGAAARRPTGAPAPASGRFGTLVAYLLDALNAVTGNLDRPGGAVFGRPPIALDEIAEKAGLATYGKVRSRIGDFPDVIGNLPGDADPARRSPLPASGRSARSSSRPATRCCRCPTATALEAGVRASSTCWSRSTSTSATPAGTPTTCFRRRRSSSARTCRSPSWASSARRSCR